MKPFEGGWLLILHQIPPKPPYFRAKVLRRLNQVGALAIKNSAYLLPSSEETLEDLQWICREIGEEGGEAWLFRADTLAGMTEEAIREAFRALRADDYREMIETAHTLLNHLRSQENTEADAHRTQPPVEPAWIKLKRRREEVKKIDFFSASGNEELETLMKSIETVLARQTAKTETVPTLPDLTGRTWVTRQGIKIDRIASAWLIRRFLDPAAKFSFVDPQTYTHSGPEIRFDMFEGEFTHEGDNCTFEVLVRRYLPHDPGLRALAEIVHDIDLKDRKYERAEALGIATVLDGIFLRQTDDLGRLAEGSAVFEALYARFKNQAP